MIESEEEKTERKWKVRPNHNELSSHTDQAHAREEGAQARPGVQGKWFYAPLMPNTIVLTAALLLLAHPV